jgi:hypothetical protein
LELGNPPPHNPPPPRAWSESARALTARHVEVAPSIVNNNRKQWSGAGDRLPQPEVGCSLAQQSRTNAGSRRSRVPGAAQHLKGVYARLGRAMDARDRAYGSASLRAAPRPGHAIASDAFGALFTFQTAHLVPAACLRPGSATLLHSPNRGVSGAPRNVRVRARHAITWRVRRLARRLAPHDAGRSPLGASPWRFFTRGRASVSGMTRIRRASSSQPGRSAWRAASRASRGEQLRAPAAGRHASLRLRDRLRRRPSMSEAANLLAQPRAVVNR